MKVVRTISAMQRLANGLRQEGRLGFVPTMGALHDGHLELVRRARSLCDHVVVSIFVNPIQFGPKEDFGRYPRNFKRDKDLLKQVGADVIFYPSADEMYPKDYATYVEVERLGRYLCGASRPGHFRGVATVVAKLFNIVNPHVAFFGQKDAQQAFIIRRMVRDLNFDIRLVVVPTKREPDGLALSSRNVYLSPEERKEAPVLFRALVLAKKLIRAGERNPARVKKAMRRLIQSQPKARIDYIEITDTREIVPVRRIKGEVLIALAVFFGRTRLIDNLILRV
ncbi:MAG: pantoate--beta-alanine ligase [candidate division WOR-3 bacterium]